LRARLQQPGGNPLADLTAALDRYASFGITTVQDGAISEPSISLLQDAANAGLIDLDVVIYPVVGNADLAAVAGMVFGIYRNRLKFGGVKMVLDGSPQGKTAYLSRPYHVPPPGQSLDYRGYPIHPDDEVRAMVKAYLDVGLPIIAHANGDAAAEQLIDAVAAAKVESDHRTVMIHAQTVREDQLDRMARLGIIPSYFSAHAFYWGDWHRNSVLGAERANRISPARSTVDRGMRFTVHNDAPIVPPDMIRLLWATTNRITRSDRVLGADQRIPTIEALRAMTSHAAYQYFEEDRKGTLTAGKLADLVVLSEDPLLVPTAELERLEVLETWSHGRQVYAR
jgi:predicted amidohydrolase YtcJ